MTQRSQPFRALQEMSPVLGLALLLGLPPLMAREPVGDAALSARNEAVEVAIEDVPYRIGAWIGSDIEIPPAAIEILQTNAILSRRYEHLRTGLVANLLVVHCSDARDMQGHYPPVCYPANGWILPAERGEHVTTVDGGGAPRDATVYEFERLDEFGTRLALRVFNYFVLPDGTTSRNIEALNRVARRRARSLEGIAQVQVTFDGLADPADCTDAVNELLDGIAPLLGVLREGERVDDHVTAESSASPARR